MFRFWVIPFVLAFLLTSVISRPYDRLGDIFQAWLLAITAVTFFTFIYDKRVAKINEARKQRNKNSLMRVPENALLTLTFVGGTIGALVARAIANHKTTKVSFVRKFQLTILFQILAIIAYFAYFSAN